MGDRYAGGYGRPRSPLYNPQRASLPINVGGYSAPVYEHSHAIPVYRRENRAGLNYSGGPVITTTYKIKPEKETRSTSRTRSATLDSRPAPLPTIVTSAPRARPVVHASGRPASPVMKTPKSSEEDYYDYAIPAATKQHRRRRLSVDQGLVQPVREDRGYIHTRPRVAIYPNPIVRHADSFVDNYNEDGYGYTNPRDLVAYDLMNHSTTSSRRSRRDSIDSGRSRPVSITGLMDVQSPRSYDPRERGPPPSTRGFDRISSAWDSPRTSLPSVASLDPIQRPARVDNFEPKTLLEPEVPTRRSSSRRPASMYHDHRDASRDARRAAREEYVRDDYYDPRDDDLRERERGPRELRHKHERHESYDDERRAYRRERAERAERSDRAERTETPEKRERDWDDRTEKRGSEDRPEKSTHDKVVAGLSIASAALGLGAMANTMKEDKDEEPRRRDYEDEPRRRRDREEREPVDLAARDAKERRHRDRDNDREERRYREDDLPPPPPRENKERHSPDNTSRRHRDDGIPPPPRERTSPDSAAPKRPAREDDGVIQPPRRPAREDDIVQSPHETERHSPDFINLGDRDPKEKSVEDDARPRKSRSEAATVGSAIETDSSVSDDTINARPRRPKHNGGSNVPFNPKDTMDLMALKAALNKDSSPPPPKELVPVAIKPATRESLTKDAREVAEIRTELAEAAPRGRRDPLEPSSANTNRQLRVVSPPRETSLDKPVKGILRQPREKFPEDPSPIREGVAPLKDAKKDGVPPDARWTKIARKLVNPEALDIGKERYEARDDFVIVLRVLSREEIQGYASATQQIRGMYSFLVSLFPLFHYHHPTASRYMKM